MAYLFKRTAIADVNHAFRLAAAVGIGFAGTAITMAYIWEGKSTKSLDDRCRITILSGPWSWR